MTMNCETKSIDMGARKPFSILYVEDEEMVRFTIAKILTRQYPHILIDTAENGAAGLEIFKKLNHDMVITDQNMPIMTGTRMACEIRSLRPKTTILFLTAGLNLGSIQFLIAEGLMHYLEKPVNFNLLFRFIDGYV